MFDLFFICILGAIAICLLLKVVIIALLVISINSKRK